MKDASECCDNRCTGVLEPLAAGTAFCIRYSRGELQAAVTAETVARTFEIHLEETGAITARPFWKRSQHVQPAVIAPKNKLEGAICSSRGKGDDVPFQGTVRLCTAPARELETCYELVCAAGRRCAQQRHPRAVRSLQMGSALPTLQPKQPEAQTFRLVLNPVPKIHPYFSCNVLYPSG